MSGLPLLRQLTFFCVDDVKWTNLVLFESQHEHTARHVILSVYSEQPAERNELSLCSYKRFLAAQSLSKSVAYGHSCLVTLPVTITCGPYSRCPISAETIMVALRH